MLDRVLGRLVGDHPLGPGDPLGGGALGQGRTDSTTSRYWPAMSWARMRSKQPRPRASWSAGRPHSSIRLVGPAEAEVPREDRAGDPEALRVSRPPAVPVPCLQRPVRRRGAAAGVAAVDDIVVEESGGLEELRRAGEGDGGGGVRHTPGAVADIEEGGPQALATTQQGTDDVEEIGGLGL